VCWLAIEANVLQIAEGGNYEALIFNKPQTMIRSTDVQFITALPLLANCCYTLARLISKMFNWNTKPSSFLF
jgi:hypothetical protein